MGKIVPKTGFLVFSPDRSRLAGVGAEKVRLWDAQTGKELLSFEGRRGDPNGVAFSPDGKRLASASGSPAFGPFAVKVWDVQTGQELLSLHGHTGFFNGVAFSPDGKRLASAAFPLPFFSGKPYFSTTVKVWMPRPARNSSPWRATVAKV